LILKKRLKLKLKINITSSLRTVEIDRPISWNLVLLPLGPEKLLKNYFNSNFKAKNA
jgi:hypothetical protein